MRKNLFCLSCLFLVAAIPAMAEETPAPVPAPQAQTGAPAAANLKSVEPGVKPAHPAGGQEAQTSQDSASLSGEVLETMSNGGYSYIYLQKKNGEKVWVAVTATPVTVGSQMSFKPGMTMGKFESKGLKRTFDSIIFSEGPVSSKTNVKHHSEASLNTSTGGKALTEEKQEKISIEKAKGANAITVEEAFTKNEIFDKKEVVVRGKVVKVSAEIMSKNWIHIQDGTGSESSGNNNLVCTSKELPAIGDVVSVTGTLAANRDFGAGYKYKAIVENTVFVK